MSDGVGIRIPLHIVSEFDHMSVKLKFNAKIMFSCMFLANESSRAVIISFDCQSMFGQFCYIFLVQKFKLFSPKQRHVA